MRNIQKQSFNTLKLKNESSKSSGQAAQENKNYTKAILYQTNLDSLSQ